MAPRGWPGEAHGCFFGGFSSSPGERRRGLDPGSDPRGPPPPVGTRNAVSAETRRPPAAAPDSCGPDGGAPPPPEAGGAEAAGEGEGPRRRELPRKEKSLRLGGRRPEAPACDRPQPRRRGRLRLMAKRPSDRRSPGRNPGPQGAFEVSMINVSCNSH